MYILFDIIFYITFLGKNNCPTGINRETLNLELCCLQIRKGLKLLLIFLTLSDSHVSF